MQPTRPPDFSQAPMIAIWEAARACDLACRHYRAEAVPGRDAAELTTVEACGLLDQERQGFGPILFVITGGDPLRRPDLETIIAHGAGLDRPLRSRSRPPPANPTTATSKGSAAAGISCRFPAADAG